MCQAGQISSAADALSAVSAGLAWLGDADVTQLTGDEQAGCLHALGRAESQALAARSRALAAFDSSRGFEADGAGSSRSWLRARTRVTGQAAAASVAWMRRLAAHPETAAALAAGEISPSWARQVCGWTQDLPGEVRADAEQVLLAAARGVADLGDLAGLAEEIHRRTAGPDSDPTATGSRSGACGWMSTTRATGSWPANLSQRCTAALRAVFESLAGKTGPEDTRTLDQRRHDALEEALERLLAARLVPGRAGQPSVIQLNMDLGQLLGLDGAGAGGRGLGRVRRDRAAGRGLRRDHRAGGDRTSSTPACWTSSPRRCCAPAPPALRRARKGRPGVHGRGRAPGVTGPGSGGAASGAGAGLQQAVHPRAEGRMSYTPAPEPGTAARELILTRATRLLAGPHGLAAYLRRSLTSTGRPGWSACRWTSASPPRSSPRTCAAPWCCGTSTVRSRAVSQPPGRLSRPSRAAAQPGRGHQPCQLHPSVPVPPPDRRPPVALDHPAQPRRHHHRGQSRRPRKPCTPTARHWWRNRRSGVRSTFRSRSSRRRRSP